MPEYQHCDEIYVSLFEKYTEEGAVHAAPDNLFRPGHDTFAGGFLARKADHKAKAERTVRKFKCTNCGVCCSGEFIYKQKVLNDEYGIFYTFDPEDKILALWPWEAERLRQLGDAMRLRTVLRPASFIVDKKERRAVILMWFLDVNSCPFHLKDRCSIRRDRPFTCKEFPLYGYRNRIGISSQCPEIVRSPMGDDDEENGRTILASYRDEIVYLFKDMDIYRMVFDFLGDLEKNDIIKWDRAATVDEATLLIDDKKARLDLFELILANGIMTKEQLEQLVERLESVEDVKGHLDLKISKNMTGI
jgi:Fe-S-cluster containining protein